MAKSGKNSTCPPNKFGFLSGCITWNTVLIAILFIVILFLLGLMFNKSKHIAMIQNDISNTTGMPNDDLEYSNQQNYTTSRNNSNLPLKMNVKRIGEKFEPNDTLYSPNEGTGTPTSDRIQYDINLNIRDIDSYRQNPNLISYGRYEAEKNVERIINPLLPPERSYTNTYGIPINIPSRGPQQSYQQVGILYKENIENPGQIPGNNNETNVLPLFGRPTYSGSNRWNYYTSSDKFQTVKLPISLDGRKCTDDLGCNELRDGDMVVIPSYNGRFRVEIYDFDKPRYIPYVY